MSSFITEILLFSSVLLLFVIAVQLICLRQSAALKYRIWTSSVIGLLILPLFCLSMPRWIGSQKTENVETMESQTAPEPIVRREVPPMLQEYADITQFQQALPQPIVYEPQIPVTVPEVDQTEVLPNVSRLENTVNTEVAAIPFSPEPEQTVKSHKSWEFLIPGLLLVWCLGMIGGLFFLVRSFFTVRKRLRDAIPLENDRIGCLCRSISEKLGLHRKITLLAAENIQIPLVTGCFRATILLPKACSSWGDEKLCAVLIHELAHIKRNDIFWQILTRLVCSFYWFHPLVWVVAWRIREERETACDDMVLLCGQQPSFYADVLLGIASHATGRSHGYGCAVAMARSSRIERRIRSILSLGKNRSPVRRLTVLLIGLFVLGIVSVSVMFSPFTPPMLFRPGAVMAEEETGPADETEKIDEQETGKPETLSPETRNRLLALYNQQYQLAVKHEETIKSRYEMGHVQGTIFAMQDAICRRCLAEMDRLEFFIETDADNAEQHRGKLREVCRELLEAATQLDQAAEASLEVGKISPEEFTRSQRERYGMEIRVIRLFPDMVIDQDENEIATTSEMVSPTPENDHQLQTLMARSEMEVAIYGTMQSANETTPEAVSYLELKRQYSKCVEAELAIKKHEQTVYGKHEGEDFDLHILHERYNLAKAEYETAQSANEKAPNAVSELEMLQLYQKVQEAQLNLEKHKQTD